MIKYMCLKKFFYFINCKNLKLISFFIFELGNLNFFLLNLFFFSIDYFFLKIYNLIFYYNYNKKLNCKFLFKINFY